MWRGRRRCHQYFGPKGYKRLQMLKIHRLDFSSENFGPMESVLSRGRPVEPRSALVKNRGVRGQFQSWFETPFSRTYLSKAQTSFRLIIKNFENVKILEFWMNFEVWYVIEAIISTSNDPIFDRIWNRSNKIGPNCPIRDPQLGLQTAV